MATSVQKVSILLKNIKIFSNRENFSGEIDLEISYFDINSTYLNPLKTFFS